LDQTRDAPFGLLIVDLAFGRHLAAPLFGFAVIRLSFGLRLLFGFAVIRLSFGGHSVVIRLFTAHCSLPAAHWILVISDYSPQRRRGRRGYFFFCFSVIPLKKAGLPGQRKTKRNSNL